jgi:hypothetical protein
MHTKGFSIKAKLYTVTVGGIFGALLTIVLLFMLMQYSVRTYSGALTESVGGDSLLFELIHDAAAGPRGFSSRSIVNRISKG